MSVELKKVVSVGFREVGLDEKWLQDRIDADPGLLGLGDLEIASREHAQPVGGRIDFLMRHVESEIYYEVEVMLGTLDESHIIRTIEYWDIERQRRPHFDHRAVIVAERITSRFFNVLRLLNRSVPMIAVQLNAFQLDEGNIALHAVTVLDVVEEVADIDTVDQVEQASRDFWVKKRPPESLAVVDGIVSLLRNHNMDPRITYNRHHIAVATTGYNFCWFRPGKSVGYCHIEFRLSAEARDAALVDLQNAGIDASPLRTEVLGFTINAKKLGEYSETIIDLAIRAEKYSRR